MRKLVGILFSAMVVVLFGVGVAHAAEAAGLTPEVKKFIAIAAGFGMAFASGLAALGQGRAITAAMEGIGRNPESAGRILTPMIIGLAMIEALAIYTLVIALMLVTKL